MFFKFFKLWTQAVHETMVTKQRYEIDLWVQIWNCWAESWTDLTPMETTMIGCEEDVDDEDGDGSSSSTGWVVVGGWQTI